MGCAKILLFIFNLIFVILGIAVIVSGILILTSKDTDFDVLITDSSLPIFSVGALTIALGVIIFIVAFTGCCGAIKENKCLLTVFIILLIIILVIEVVVVILGFLYPGKVDDLISDEIKEGMGQYKKNNTAYIKAWNEIQQNFTCCGVDEATDWQTSGGFEGTMVPDSCCNETITDACTTMNAFEAGCKSELLDTASSKTGLTFAGIAAIVIVLAEIFGIMFACCVIRDAGKDGKGQYS